MLYANMSSYYCLIRLYLDKRICRVSNLFCKWFKVLYGLQSALVVSWKFVCSFMCFHNRNTMFVRVLATTRITLLVDLWLGCQIFRRRRLLRINGLSIKKGYKDANWLMPCGYCVHPDLLCIVCLFLSFHLQYWELDFSEL